MAYLPILAPPMAMATTQLKRETACEFFSPVCSPSNRERQSLRLSWVVVTGSNGGGLRARWTAEESRRDL
jgi:hypothetical protein